MLHIILIVGASGSGKSTWAEEWVQHNKTYKVVSSDAMRTELWGSAEIQSNPKRVFEVVYARAHQYLAQGYNVILDATNLTKKDRKRTLEAFSDRVDVDFSCIYFKVPAGICKARQFQRNRRVPDKVIEQQCNRFEIPTVDEGFNTIMKGAN